MLKSRFNYKLRNTCRKKEHERNREQVKTNSKRIAIIKLKIKIDLIDTVFTRVQGTQIN